MLAGACWARARTTGTLLQCNSLHSRGEVSEWTATWCATAAAARRRDGRRTERSCSLFFTPVTRESTERARTGGDVLTKERSKEKEPSERRRWRQRRRLRRWQWRRGMERGREGAVTRQVRERERETRKDSGAEGREEERLPLERGGISRAKRGWRERGENGGGTRGEGEEGREPESERARASNTPSRES